MTPKTTAYGPLLTAILGAAALICLATAAWAAAPSDLGGTASETTSLLAAIVKMAGSLAVVVGLMLLLFFFLKKTGLNQGVSRPGSMIRVMDTRMIAPKKYIAIIAIADKCLAVGITDHTINLLADLGEEAQNSLSTSSENSGLNSSSFAGVLRQSLQSFTAKHRNHGQEAGNE